MLRAVGTRRLWFLVGLAALVVLAMAAAACRTRGLPQKFEAGRLGTVRLYRVVGEPRGMVFLFSDDSGWTPALDRTAAAAAKNGAVVIGVDLPSYLRGLAASDDGCHYVIAEIEDMSERIQRELGFAGYRSPILAGIGEGATLAYAALAQAPAATIDGAVSVDPSAALHTRVPLCQGAPFSPARGGGFEYGPQPKLPGWWRVSSSLALSDGLARLVTGGVEVDDKVPPAERLLAIVVAALEAEAGTNASSEVRDLPLVELPAREPRSLMAIVYSGDGGWRDLDKQIGEVLASEGVSVVGVDSLRYFWRTRTPEEVAADLGRIIRHYGTVWRAEKVVLVGYSFGAGILPFAVNRLSPGDRARIVQISLLGLESRAPFQVSLKAWFGAAPPADAPAVAPEVERLDRSLLQCFYGEDEKDTLCRSAAFTGAEVIGTKGGHHFDGDYRALARKILLGAERRLAGE